MPYLSAIKNDDEMSLVNFMFPIVRTMIVFMLIGASSADAKETTNEFLIGPDLTISSNTSFVYDIADSKAHAASGIGEGCHQAWGHGGIMPHHCASIIVFSQPLPNVALKDFVEREHNIDDKDIKSEGISGVDCMHVRTVDDSLWDVSVYCSFGKNLYKFIINYYDKDPKEKLYLAAFQKVLDSARFKHRRN